MTIRFDGRDARYNGEQLRLSLRDFSDAAIEHARRRAELVLGHPLRPFDSPVGLPPFTLFEGDEEVGGN